jgi:integrase
VLVVTELSDLGLAPATVRYLHRVFSLMLTHPVRDGRLVRNPAEGVPLPRVVKKVPVFLDHTEVDRLAEAAAPYDLLMRFLAYTSGPFRIRAPGRCDGPSSGTRRRGRADPRPLTGVDRRRW